VPCEVGVQIPLIPVLHTRSDATRSPGNDHMLVHLCVEAAPLLFIRSFVAPWPRRSRATFRIGSPCLSSRPMNQLS